MSPLPPTVQARTLVDDVIPDDWCPTVAPPWSAHRSSRTHGLRSVCRIIACLMIACALGLSNVAALPKVICDNDGDIDSYLTELCLAYHSRGEIQLLALVTTFVEADSDNFGHANDLYGKALRSGMDVDSVRVVDGQDIPKCMPRPASGVHTDSPAIPDAGVGELVAIITANWQPGEAKIQYWIGGPRSTLANAWAMNNGIEEMIVVYGSDSDTGGGAISSDLCNYNGAVDNWASDIVFHRFEWYMTSALAQGVSPAVPKSRLALGEIPDVELLGFMLDKQFSAWPGALPNGHDYDAPPALRAMLGSSYATSASTVVFEGYTQQASHVLGWSGCDPSCVRFTNGSSRVSHVTSYDQGAGTAEWWRAMSGSQSPPGGAFPNPAVSPRSQPFLWPAPAPVVGGGSRIEIEAFNWGGHGYGYSDREFGGWRKYRTVDRVDITDGFATTPLGVDSGGSYVTFESEEWAEYTVDVAAAGAYELRLRHSTSGSGRAVNLYVAEALVRTIPLPNSFGVWRLTDPHTVGLEASMQTLRVEVTGGQTSLDYLELASQMDACIPLDDVLLSNHDSEETIAENGQAANLLDGVPSTHWVSQYTPVVISHPHSIDLDLRGLRRLCRFDYTPRQNSSYGRIERYELYSCLEDCGPTGSGWSWLTSGTFPNSAAPNSIAIAPPVLATSIRLRSLRSWPTPGSSPWAAVADLGVSHVPVVGTPIDVGDESPCTPVSGDLLARYDSQETVAEDGRASNVRDGSTSTIWVTQYSAGIATHPHWLDFDLGEESSVCGVTYTPRQDSSYGRIERYELYTCLSNCGRYGAGWSLHSSGAFPNSAAPVEIPISPSVRASFVRLRALASWPTPGLSPWTTVAEIGISREDSHEEGVPGSGVVGATAQAVTVESIEDRLPH